MPQSSQAARLLPREFLALISTGLLSNEVEIPVRDDDVKGYRSGNEFDRREIYGSRNRHGWRHDLQQTNAFVVNRIPDYLKLFIEEVEEPTGGATLPEFERLWSIFPEVTGLRLNISQRENKSQLSFPWSDSKVISYKVAIEPTKRARLHSLSAARELEEALSALLTALGETRAQLRLREADLAAAVPIVSVNEDGEHLADRLEAVLRGAAEMLQCHGAGLYLLDECTTSLKLRAHYGLPPGAFLKPARRLEDSAADIEALSGHAVVIENTAETRWQIPENSKSAICVPVASGTTLLGTLWMYRDFAKDFNLSEQNLAEICAGRLASDLERSALTHEVRSLRGKGRPDDDADGWREGRAAKIAPFVDGWDVTEGNTNPRRAGDFCGWHVADGERVHLAVGAAHGFTSKQFSSVAFQATHAAHTAHDPDVKDIFPLINQSLWTSSAEGDACSMFHAILDPTCGALEYGLVGSVFAYIIRPHGWEPLLPSGQLLGVDCELDVNIQRQMVMPGDILVAFSGPYAERNRDPSHRMNQIAEQLLHHTHLSATELGAIIEDGLKDLTGPGESLALLVAKRHDLT